jgi:ATP-dependent protease HslVU (ClpYQ) peptidase subunit
LINNLANQHPEVLLKALHEFCKSQVQIKVTSSLLYYLDITALVIKKFEFKMVPGYRNVIDFELQCLSDLDPNILEQDATT